MGEQEVLGRWRPGFGAILLAVVLVLLVALIMWDVVHAWLEGPSRGGQVGVIVGVVVAGLVCVLVLRFFAGPRVILTADVLSVRNPFRTHEIPLVEVTGCSLRYTPLVSYGPYIPGVVLEIDTTGGVITAWAVKQLGSGRRVSPGRAQRAVELIEAAVAATRQRSAVASADVREVAPDTPA